MDIFNVYQLKMNALYEPYQCFDDCGDGFYCGCPRGMVKESKDSDMCVLPEACPSKCPGNQEMIACESCPGKNCDNYNDGPCNEICAMGFFCGCPNRMIKESDESDICIQPIDCPGHPTIFDELIPLAEPEGYVDSGPKIISIPSALPEIKPETIASSDSKVSASVTTAADLSYEDEMSMLTDLLSDYDEDDYTTSVV